MLALIAATALAFWATWINLKAKKGLMALGTGIICLAGVMNGTVMAFNSGRMPVRSPHVLISTSDNTHSEITRYSHLLWLADVHGAVQYRYSLGDVVVMLGLFVALVGCWFARRSN